MSTGEAGVSRTSMFDCILITRAAPGYDSNNVAYMDGGGGMGEGSELGSRDRQHSDSRSRDRHRAQPPQCGVNISFFCLYMKS